MYFDKSPSTLAGTTSPGGEREEGAPVRRR